VTAAELLADCTAREIILTVRGDRLEIDAPEVELTPELMARLQAHKPELLEILQPEPHATDSDSPAPAPQQEQPADPAAEWLERTAPNGRQVTERADAGAGWDDAIDPAPPCEKCGGILRWIDAAGGMHCPTCSPSRTADRLRRLANQARARYRVDRQAIPSGDPRAPAPWRLPPWPPVVPDEILADPIPDCRDCSRPRVISGQPGRPAGPCYRRESARCENAPRTSDLPRLPQRHWRLVGPDILTY